MPRTLRFHDVAADPRLREHDCAAPLLRRLAVFFVVVFALTWTAWAVWARLSGPSRWPVFYAGVFAPALVALLLTWIDSGAPGVRALVTPLVRWDVGARWYVFALGCMAAVKLIAAVMYRLTAGGWPARGTTPVIVLFAAAIFSTLVGGQAGEELGWRGYALPVLAERAGFRLAAVVIGVVWATWHLPLFYLAGGDLAGQSFPVFVLLVTAISVVITWLYVNTGGSLLLTMLFHAAVNNTTAIVPSAGTVPRDPMSVGASPMGWWTLAVLSIAAAIFLVLLPGRSRPT